ncbi:MAG: cobalamin B12-binding domain-containing protein [Candidatus Thorarchaeota archaeon]|jgi:corrinoid protein of di/trimethylamine methyltransferase
MQSAERRRYDLTPSIFEELELAVIEGDSEQCEELAKKSLDQKIPPLDAITNGLAKGVKSVGDKFSKGEVFLVELIMAGDAMKAGMSVLLPEIKASKAEMKTLGKVMLGTVDGDIHSIGKDIVATLLEAEGFEVINVGEDVSSEAFVKKVKEHSPDILGLSSLLTATMPAQQEVIEMLDKAGLKDKVKVIIGGAPTTNEWADEIGADGWAGDAVSAVELVKQLVGGK